VVPQGFPDGTNSHQLLIKGERKGQASSSMFGVTARRFQAPVLAARGPAEICSRRLAAGSQKSEMAAILEVRHQFLDGAQYCPRHRRSQSP
jgi:hypothetical protein